MNGYILARGKIAQCNPGISIKLAQGFKLQYSTQEVPGSTPGSALYFIAKNN